MPGRRERARSTASARGASACVRSRFAAREMPANLRLGALRAPGSGHLDLDREHLAARVAVADALGPAPLGGDDAERPPVVATEHAGEAASVDLDRLQH